MQSTCREEVIIAQKVSGDVLLREGETSSILGLSKRTLQDWRVRGCGPKFVKVGRSVRYRLEDVQAFVNENVHQSTSEKSYRVKGNLLTV
jgi:predicted DNA-binding transcriptional regulator AlpA